MRPEQQLHPMKGFIIFLLMTLAINVNGQNEVAATVTDTDGNPLLGVTVVLENDRSVYAFTDENGSFSLDLTDESLGDNIRFTYTGKEDKLVRVGEIIDGVQTVELMSMADLDEVVIIAKRAISEEFSVKQLDPLDIYFNPLAKADPLNAIQILPASTDTEENASPSLRGSLPDRSVVIVEGVPVRNPVRNNQLNGVGNFSIFSTELLKSQWVYASNPPLAYGNSSAGLVEIELEEVASAEGLAIGAGLAQVGGSFTKDFNSNGFLTIYGNHGFSNLYKAVNASSIDNLNDFTNTDLGLRFYHKIGDQSDISLLNYSATEGYDVDVNIFAHRNQALASQKRNFTVLKLTTGDYSNKWSLHSGYDLSDSNFDMGNLRSDTKRSDLYNGLNYRHNSEEFVVQAGISHRWSSDEFNEQLPQYYYQITEGSSHFTSDTLLTKHDVQSYVYGKYYLGDLTAAAGLRKNLFAEDDDFLSYQLSLKYDLNNQHYILASGGKYHNTNYPSSEGRHLDLLKSDQLAVEYRHLKKGREVLLAGFVKQEDNDELVAERIVNRITGKRAIKGLEFSWSETLFDNLTLDFANTFLDVQMIENGEKVQASNDLNYIIKMAATYFNNDVFSFGSSLVARQGRRFTDVNGATYRPFNQAFEPQFNQLNSSRYNDYANWSFTANRAFSLPKDRSLVVYGVFNNVLNNKNQSQAVYVNDYSSKTYDYYSGRYAYAGVMVNF